MVYCKEKCNYTHCIRLFKSDEAAAAAKIEYQSKTHKATNQTEFNIARKKLTDDERNLIQQLKGQYNLNPPLDCVTNFIFDFKFTKQCQTVEDLIRGLLNSDGYVGQSRLAIRPIENVMELGP